MVGPTDCATGEVRAIRTLHLIASAKSAGQKTSNSGDKWPRGAAARHIKRLDYATPLGRRVMKTKLQLRGGGGRLAILRARELPAFGDGGASCAPAMRARRRLPGHHRALARSYDRQSTAEPGWVGQPSASTPFFTFVFSHTVRNGFTRRRVD